MNECVLCKQPAREFISYGKQPIANGFLKEEEFSKEYFFELRVGFCSHCSMVQLLEQPDQEQMFHENYAFFSGTSSFMTEHFKKFSQSVIDTYLSGKSDPFVVEIGSNDGIMLINFVEKGIRCLGIEPSENVAKRARERGVPSQCSFFDEKIAAGIVEKQGQADAFLAANVMCHIPYLHSVAKGIKTLLKPDGVLLFEDPYLGDVLEKTSYDQFYDEHRFIFSANSIKKLFEQYDMELIDVFPQETHGGSMRYVLANKGHHPVSKKVEEQLKYELDLGMDEFSTYEQFRKNCEKSRVDLRNLLAKLKKENKRVVGYAATSKSTTILNYCDIDRELIDFISDTTPNKQGKYSPGKHIPVKSYEHFKEKYPDYALLFGWNHKKEIFAKETDFFDKGGKWITYVPQVEILS